MKPLEMVKKCVMLRLRRETWVKLDDLAHKHGQRVGPFSVMLMETIAKCPPEKLHAALAEFSDEAGRR